MIASNMVKAQSVLWFGEISHGFNIPENEN